MILLLGLLACTPAPDDTGTDIDDTELPVGVLVYRPPPGFYIKSFETDGGEYTVILSKPGREVVIEACHPDMYGVTSTTFPETDDGVVWLGTEPYFEDPQGWEVTAVSIIGNVEREVYGENCGGWGE